MYSTINLPRIPTIDTPTPESEIARLRRELEEEKKNTIIMTWLLKLAIIKLKQGGLFDEREWSDKLAMSGGKPTQQNGETTAQLQGGGGLLQDGHRRAEAGNHREE